MMKIKYLKHDLKMKDLEFIGGEGNSCAIDLYTAEDIEIRPFEFKLIDLGVSIDIPAGYKAELRMRSSTFKNFNILQTNSMGLIDTTYVGANDIIKLPVYCVPVRKGIENMESLFNKTIIIPKHTRIAQLEILQSTKDIELVPCHTIEEYGNKQDRGGFGSTGTL